MFITSLQRETPDITIQRCRPIEYDAKITEVRKTNRDLFIKGIDIKGNEVEYEMEGGFWDVYLYAEVGDSIKKILGELKVRIIKKDTTINIVLKSNSGNYIGDTTVMNWNDNR